MRDYGTNETGLVDIFDICGISNYFCPCVISAKISG